MSLTHWHTRSSSSSHDDEGDSCNMHSLMASASHCMHAVRRQSPLCHSDPLAASHCENTSSPEPQTAHPRQSAGAAVLLSMSLFYYFTCHIGSSLSPFLLFHSLFSLILSLPFTFSLQQSRRTFAAGLFDRLPHAHRRTRGVISISRTR